MSAPLSERLARFCDSLIHQEECRGFVPEVRELEQLAADLLEWHDRTGGWDGPVWRRAERLVRMSDTPATDPEVIELCEAVRGLLDILEGESGAGANYWENDPRYERARRLVSNFPTTAERPKPGTN